MGPIRNVLGLAAVAVTLAACAAATPGYSPTPRKVTPDDTGSLQGDAYVLSAEEQKLDCRKLSGRMQVRILQIRDREAQSQGTAAGRVANSAAASVLGNQTLSERFAEDRAMLEAYNRQLAAKNCPTFDLAAELKPKAIGETPRPVPKEPAKKS